MSTVKLQRTAMLHSIDRQLPRKSRWSLVVLLTTAVGCGSGGGYVPAAGTLTVAGKPVEGAQVVFTPTVSPADGAAPVARGVTDASGQFRLKTLTPEKALVDGAVVGSHRVAVVTRIVGQDVRGNTRVVREEMLSEPYVRGDQLTIEVPVGGADDLLLECPPK